MKRIHSIIAIAIITSFALLSACTDRYPIGELANNSNRLVVEGRFTNATQTHTIYLSRTVAYTAPTPNGSGYPVETGATVTITDDQDNAIPFNETSPGVYITASSGEVGRIYTLNITTSNGKQYSSEPEKMSEVPAIKDLKVRYEDRAIPFEDTTNRVTIISIQSEDLQKSNAYYMWYWKSGQSSQFNTVDSSWNWTYAPGRLISGTEEGFDLAELSDNNTKSFVKVYQTSISQKAYDFLQALNSQSNNNLGPFSTPPAPIRGNIINNNDEKDFALGFFTVSGVHSATVKLE
ncbi:DUF4249 domain-containing protein [Microscilla marina]|uniref:Lipoprotein, putative n=1 Tax=Microscilla marina ATCC 23134 TaxID=313606 RepID=A1ZZ38_MICM2|nr:DUF4249 domain-containing protein [Microscilla marina]EAY24360.1 lipoprotein, putative [Microscilla marina ATCC 23134]